MMDMSLLPFKNTTHKIAELFGKLEKRSDKTEWSQSKDHQHR